MTETERLIEDVLRLDAEATKGPWMYAEEKPSYRPTIRGIENKHVCDFGYNCTGWNGDMKGNEPEGEDLALVLAYRSSAPRLARMLRVAMLALSSDDCNVAEIERIAKEEA